MSAFSTRVPPHRLARVVLAAFLYAFIGVRLVLLAAEQDIVHGLPVGELHGLPIRIGVLLLAGVGAYLLLMPAVRPGSGAALLYGVGLGLIVCAFGAQLHSGGGTVRKAVFDLIVLGIASLALLSVAPPVSRFQRRHWTAVVLLAAMMAAYAYLSPDLWPSRSTAEESSGPAADRRGGVPLLWTNQSDRADGAERSTHRTDQTDRTCCPLRGVATLGLPNDEAENVGNCKLTEWWHTTRDGVLAGSAHRREPRRIGDVGLPAYIIRDRPRLFIFGRTGGTAYERGCAES